MNVSTPLDSTVAAAVALREARLRRIPIAPISRTHGVTTLAQAYEVARVNVVDALQCGRTLAGRKIGLTSRAVQQQLGVDQPDFGALFSDMEFRDGDELPTQRLLQPKAEAEVAFVIGRDLVDPELTWGRFLLGIEYALPAIEVVDSAIADWQITLADTVADNASCGLYVLGSDPRRITDLSLQALGMEARRNGRLVSTGSGSACLGHPLNAAFWLARTLASLDDPLRAGDVVLSGALGPMFTFEPGDTLSIELGPLGRVACRAN